MSGLAPEDLAAIKVRAAEPDKVFEWAGNPYMDEYIDALQKSQEDVPALVVEVERLRAREASASRRYS